MSFIHPLLIFIILSALVQCEARVGGSSVQQNEDRDLGYYGYANQHYYGGGGGKHYYGGGRHYYGGGRRYYRYYKKRYYNQKEYYGSGGKNAVEDVDEYTTESTDDLLDSSGENYYNETTWRAKISALESQAEESVFELYQTSPGEWTLEQWLLVSGILALTLGMVVCTCCCCSSCCGRGDKKGRKQSEYDFDDYTSIDSRKGSFMTKGSESTDFDDNATYDTIMRLRSD
jgi:hypothetical protein